MNKQLLILALSALGGLASAHAADIGQHPAVFSPRSLPGIEADHFIVGHPAGGRPLADHAKQPHPAVILFEQSRPPVVACCAHGLSR